MAVLSTAAPSRWYNGFTAHIQETLNCLGLNSARHQQLLIYRFGNHPITLCVGVNLIRLQCRFGKNFSQHIRFQRRIQCIGNFLI